MTYAAEIINTVTSWQGVVPIPHRFGGTEFNLENVEIGHIHGSTMVDIPFTRAIRAALVTDGEAEPHHLLHDSGWISFYLRRDEDAAQAIKLLRLSYLQKRVRWLKPEDLPGYREEVTALDVSNDLKALLLARLDRKSAHSVDA